MRVSLLIVKFHIIKLYNVRFAETWFVLVNKSLMSTSALNGIILQHRSQGPSSSSSSPSSLGTKIGLFYKAAKLSALHLQLRIIMIG